MQLSQRVVTATANAINSRVLASNTLPSAAAAPNAPAVLIYLNNPL